MRTSLSVLPIPLALLLAASAAAQAPDSKATGSRGGERPVSGELMKAEEGGEGGKVEAPRYRPARGFCSFVLSVTPARVPPGGRGTLIVTMLFEGNAVMTAPPPVRFNIPSEQGPFQVGPASFRPPKAGYLTEAFRGQPVYDNYAIFEVPFGVDRSSPLGKFRLGGELEFDLHNGSTGQPIQTFLERVGISVEVGEAPAEAIPVLRAGGTDDAVIPMPTSGRAGAEQRDTGEPTAGRDQEPAVGLQKPERAIGAELGNAETPAGPGSTQSPDGFGQLDEMSAPTGSNLPWLLGGLAAVLLLLGLVLLRRR